MLDPEGRSSPSMAAAWLRLVAEADLADGREPLVAVARDAGGRPQAGIALTVQTLGRGRARVRLGSWLGHPRRVYQADLLAPAGDDAAGEVLAAALGEVSGLVLHDAPSGGGAVRAVRARAPGPIGARGGTRWCWRPTSRRSGGGAGRWPTRSAGRADATSR